MHTVKGFGLVNKAEADVFLELSCFLNDPVDVGNLISGSSAFSTVLQNPIVSLSHEERTTTMFVFDNLFENSLILMTVHELLLHFQD